LLVGGGGGGGGGMGVNLRERRGRQENWTEQNFENLANILDMIKIARKIICAA
jgi:hypothetical protein